jgi:signal transduction histidine kinase
MESPRRRGVFNAGTVAAVVVTEGAAFAQSLFGPHRPTALLAACAVVVAAASAGTLWAVDQGRRTLVRTCLAADVVLGAVFTLVSHGTDILGLFPIVAVVLVATSLSVTALSIAAFAGLVLWVGLDLGLAASSARAFGYVSGAVFVAAFTRIALAEQRARAELARMASHVEDLAAARERNRIAREIHDGVGHALTAVHVHLEAARGMASKLAAAEAVVACVERAQEEARGALKEVRRSVAMLRAPVAEKTLVEAVRALAEDCRGAGVEVEVTVDGVPRQLPPAAEFALYRAAQEALTNVQRHAGAKGARIALSFEASETHLRVTDDGVGRAEDRTSGFGLLGMRERAGVLGGSVEVRSAPGAGFEVHVRLPA